MVNAKQPLEQLFKVKKIWAKQNSSLLQAEAIIIQSTEISSSARLRAISIITTLATGAQQRKQCIQIEVAQEFIIQMAKTNKQSQKHSSNTCVICKVKKNNATVNCCKHEFCILCIKKWTKKNNCCPLCRAVITTIYYRKKQIAVPEVRGKIYSSISQEVANGVRHSSPQSIGSFYVNERLRNQTGRHFTALPLWLQMPQTAILSPLNSYNFFFPLRNNEDLRTMPSSLHYIWAHSTIPANGQPRMPYQSNTYMV